MSNKLFAGLPGIAIPRSKFPSHYNLPMTFPHGKLIPMDAIPIVPGDGLHFRFKDLNWMQTPIAPLFGNIKKHFAAFFVPYRLIFNRTEELFGANKTSAGPQAIEYKFPHALFAGGIEAGSPSHYLGKPIVASGAQDADGEYFKASILKERAYYLVYNEYFRASQITNPVLLETGVTEAGDDVVQDVCIGYWNGDVVDPGSKDFLMPVAKEFDYFTSNTISPQYGAAVELPLGTSAPIIFETDESGFAVGDNFAIGFTSDSETRSRFNLGANQGAGSYSVEGGEGLPYLGLQQYGRLYADLSTATAAKVNDVRYAFAVQKYLERANFAGNYFFGILQVHYGITSPDSRLQRPEFLGEFSEDILIQQVIATADTTNSGVATPVGQAGAKSCTFSGEISLFDKAFVEPGLVLLVCWTKHRQLYSGGIMREDLWEDRMEFYSPEFCNLGDQATKTKEIYWKASKNDIFGYQEHWAELRYRPDRVSGLLDPYATGGLPYWTLAHKFTAKPELNDDFIFEDAADIDRALTTGSSIDEYISDTYIELTWTRELPVRTMPGLIDHFGAW